MLFMDEDVYLNSHGCDKFEEMLFNVDLSKMKLKKEDSDISHGGEQLGTPLSTQTMYQDSTKNKKEK